MRELGRGDADRRGNAGRAAARAPLYLRSLEGADDAIQIDLNRLQHRSGSIQTPGGASRLDPARNCGRPGRQGEWRQWRGPTNNGVAEGDAPLQFSDTENVKWRVRIPGKGHSTPLISGGTIYLTTAVESGTATESGSLSKHDFLVLALDTSTGKEIWRRNAVSTSPHEGYHRRYGSFASNSPVTDGEVLITNFGSRGVYAYDLDGKLLWKKDLGKLYMRNAFGEGIAPVLHGDSLVIQNDHEGDSYIVVLDKNSGKELWRAERDELSSWPQPIVIEYDGQEQLVTSATRVRSYDLKSGALIWEAGGLGGNAIPAVINVDDEMVIAMTGWPRPEPAGDPPWRQGRHHGRPRVHQVDEPERELLHGFAGTP